MKEEKLSGRVVLKNRNKLEFGTIVQTYRRKKIRYYDVMTERGVLLEMVSTDSNFPCYIQVDYKRLADGVVLDSEQTNN